jgi:rod shape-determining protein MreC
MHSFWRNRPLLITIVTLVILFVLLIITAGQDDATGAESLIGGVMQPMQGFFYDTTDAIAAFVSGIFTPNTSVADIAKLKERIADLEGQVKEFEEVKQENDRLQKLVTYIQQNTQFSYITARVTGKSAGQWFVVFNIDAGVNNGVRKDMAVVNSEGLVGRVIDTGANWSQVMALIDSRSNVSGLVERTRDNGIVGQADVSVGEAMLNMEYLPLDADLMPGDKIITSGIDGYFPKGLEIGEIIKTNTGKDNMKKSAIIKPVVDFLHLEEVMVVTEDKTTEETTKTTEETAKKEGG